MQRGFAPWHWCAEQAVDSSICLRAERARILTFLPPAVRGVSRPGVLRHGQELAPLNGGYPQSCMRTQCKQVQPEPEALRTALAQALLTTSGGSSVRGERVFAHVRVP